MNYDKLFIENMEYLLGMYCKNIYNSYLENVLNIMLTPNIIWGIINTFIVLIIIIIL